MVFWTTLSEALKQKGFSAQQIKKLVEQFGTLAAAGLLTTPPDRVLAVMTGRTVRERQEKLETLLAVARELQAQLGSGQPSPSRESFTITGQIRTTDGQPLANATVRAFERGIGREALLGEVTTDTDGTYRIAIPLEKFISLERKRPHLVVRAYTERNKLLGTSETIFNATSGQAVDLKVESIEEAPLSAYETLAAKLRPLLGGQQLADLSDDDTKILGVETSVDLKQIQWLRQGARLARVTRLPAEIFHALASQKLPLELEKLLAQSDEEIQAALEAALKQNVIPAMPDGFMDNFLARFAELRVEQGLLLQHEITGQLQNQETDKPLAGFTVRIVELSAQPRDRESAMTSTDQAGEFSITYTARPRSQARRSFRLHILDRQGKELHTTEVTAQPGQAKLNTPISIQLPPIERPSPRITELAASLRLNLAPELSTALERRKIATLDDIRRTGGLDRLKDAAVGPDDPAVKRLQAHADLNVLSDDIKVNDALIDKGYDSIYAVSRKTRRDFTKDMQASLGEEQAVRLNDVARKQSLLLDNLATMHRVDRANGYLNNSATTDDYPDLEPPCHCRDCASAASPLAYLTDLLDYAVRHVKNDDEAIALPFLEQSFHQPFGAMPASCETAEQSIRQVRLAVEVLRSILDETNLEPSITQQLLSADRHYCMAAYESLLLQIGTSYDELRLVRRGSHNEQNALAERLAISQLGSVSPHQLINQLWLDQDKAYPDLQALNEVNLERLFGLPTTYVQSRFSKGAKLGDEQDQISDWQLDGLAWLRNTDENGRVHLRLNKSGNKVMIKLYRNQARHETSLVASGSRTGNNGTVSLGEENLSGLSGTLTVQYQATANNISIVAFPFFLSWRLAYLQQQWLASKKPQYASPFGAPPVIDPDLVGPDDFRHPEPGNPAFDIWLVRRNWVDDLLKELRSQTKTAADGQTVPDVQRMLDVMEDTGWQATTIADLEALDDLIQQATDLDAATTQLGRLFLSKASFRRMMDINAKSDRWENNTGEAVTDDEWEEFYSILVQSLKQAMGAAWRTQEQGISGTLRSLEYFWPALREPVEGQWPPLRPHEQPWIDPDTVKEGDLPDSVAGDQARMFLQDRRAELIAVNEQLQATREAHGLEALLVQALGATLTGSSWDDELNRLQEDRLSSNAATANAARDQIASDLRMSESEFDLLMAVKTKAGQTDSAQAPKPEDWASVYTLLTRVKKERVNFPQWRAAENNLTYWIFRKARLPRWRATAEARQVWHEALYLTANLPAIDPDLLDTADFITPFSEDKAFGLWQERASELSTLKQELTNVTGTSHLEKIDKLLITHLGVKADRLEALIEAANEGNLTTARLQQLTVSWAELDFLLRVRALASQDSASSAVIDEEWDDLYDILILVEKRRKLFPKWRSEEHNLSLVLSPDYFKLQPQLWTTASPPPSPINTWRAKASDRRDWDKTLKARIEQQNSITQALRSAVYATEEATLPDLRNDLIGVLNEPDKALAVEAKEMNQRLLIDMTNGGCQMTTRAGQAIVTIQLLLWSLRTGQLKVAWPHLSLDAEDFDEEWKWLGSYATWRAAMMVFLYPENILLPNLRRHQTPALRVLIAKTQFNTGLTSEDTVRLVNEYATYFQDTTNLELEAACDAETLTPIADTLPGHSSINARYKRITFLFARSKNSDTVYWSTHDSQNGKDYAQSFWEPVPGLNELEITRIIGASPFRVSDGRRYLYLFFQAKMSNQTQIAFTKFALDNRQNNRWDEEVTNLPIGPYLPEEENVIQPVRLDPPVAVLCQNRSESRPPLVAVQLDGTFPGSIYGNELNESGDGWRHVIWQQWPALRSQIGFPQGGYYLLSGLTDQHIVERDNQGSIQGYVFIFQESKNPDVGYFSDITTNVAAFCDVAQMGRYDNLTSGEIEFYRQEYSIQILGSLNISHRFGGLYHHLPSGFIYVFLTRESANSPYEYAVIKYTIGIAYAGGGFSYIIHNSPITGDIVACGGIRDNGKIAVAYQRRDAKGGDRPRNGLFLAECQPDEATQYITVISTTRIAPHLLQPVASDPDIISEHDGMKLTPLSKSERAARRIHTNLALLYSYRNDLLPWYGSASLAIRDYIEEAYYLVPLHLALYHQRARQYALALDWYRNIYNYTAPLDEREIYYGLKQEESPSIAPRSDWLLDPLNPHEIARGRGKSYTRFTLISLIQCLLAYADAEFGQDTSESNARARQLYTQALDLLDTPELKQKFNQCDAMIGEIVVQFARFHQIDPEVARMALESLDASALRNTSSTIRSILNTDETQEMKAVKVLEVLHGVRRDAFEHKDISDNIERRHLDFARAHRALLANSQIQMYLVPNSDSQTNQWFYTPQNVLSMSWLPTTFTFCIPPNPILSALRFHAELNLYKLRTCRNIAGMERVSEPYSAPTDVASGLPTIGAGGQLTLPGAYNILPTRYRYRVLADRAKQLTDIARQMESTFLSFLVEGDAGRYNVLKARQDARLARAGVRLQDLRVQESENGVSLADLQRERAVIQKDHFAELLRDRELWQETGTLWFQGLAAAAYLAGAAVQSGGMVAAGIALAAETGSASLWASFIAAAGVASGSVGSTASATASWLSTWANFERRRQEWEFQKSLAQHDWHIGTQQITLAKDRVRITGQEREISRIQVDHADDVIEFLNAKNLSIEMYDWMSGVMERVYCYFLQQATGVARLAENQLAFERQEMPPAFMQADYWDAPRDGSSITNENGNVTDRRGLTGSARLLLDIYRLDQYAFETDKRKLQLTKTISLARLDPFAFQQFRETGIMIFATPMPLFNRDFPGHYLRLIKRVRTSVIALIPPIEGVKATLSTTGISRVVIGGELFQTTVVNRGTESVALSSPQNATGLFELESQGQAEMLLPFEGLGVDTTWEFRLPKPANAFDYRTIADVLITIEYTALDSPTYRQQVIQQLDRTVIADRPFSFRHQFADAWYDLHHPDLVQAPQQPMEVSFATRREDFPPNVTDLKIEHVTLYIAHKSGTTVEFNLNLKFVPLGTTGNIGGAATTVAGAASTRQNSAGSWMIMIGESPAGEWTLAFDDKEGKFKDLFANNQIEDILFVITFGGQTAAWPA